MINSQFDSIQRKGVMKMKKFLVLLTVMSFFLVPSISQAVNIEYLIGADDYVDFRIDGNVVISFDKGENFTQFGSVDLAEGWYDVLIDYRNKGGTSGMQLFWDQGNGSPQIKLPAAYLRSQDAGGQWVNGLKADYYWIGGSVFHTEYGEGPIYHHGGNYEDVPGADWPGGASGLPDLYSVAGWGELITGDIWVGTSAPTSIDPVPEPATMLLLGSGLLGLAGFRRKFRKR